jgi:hypothetical protein
MKKTERWEQSRAELHPVVSFAPQTYHARLLLSLTLRRLGWAKALDTM